MTTVRLLPGDVDVAVVSHNGRTTLPGVLAGLAGAGVPPDRLRLYDIASTDDSVEWLAREWPTVRVTRLATNDGPNPARNLAIADATRPFLLLVDSDAYLEPDSITALRAAVAGTAIGAAVPVVVHAHQPDRLQYAGSRLHFICEAINPWSDRLVTDRGAAIAEIGTAPGVTFLLNVEAARQIGGFDARYFMGKEDGEFCYRLRVAGFRLVETPTAVARHGSRPRSTWLFRYQLRNRWHFMLKNYEARTLLVLAPALLIHECLQFAVLVLNGHFATWCQAASGLTAWLRQLPADRASVVATRRVHDRILLSAAPLIVRPDVIGTGWGQTAKRAYDRWLSAYWWLASRLLS